MGGGSKIGANFPKISENESENWEMSHIVQQRQRYTKENWPVSVDAWIMQAYFSFDKIFRENKF